MENSTFWKAWPCEKENSSWEHQETDFAILQLCDDEQVPSPLGVSVSPRSMRELVKSMALNTAHASGKLITKADSQTPSGN